MFSMHFDASNASVPTAHPVLPRLPKIVSRAAISRQR
jgi:hypothetical protein